MNIKNRQQLLLVLAVAGVGLLASDKLIISPLTASWKDRARQISELKQSVGKGAQLLARQQSIESGWERMRTNTLPVDLSAAENLVLKAFDRWSQESRVSISSIKPEWKRNADDYMTLECRADAFGSIEAISKFLYEVEKDPLALRIEAVEIAAKDNNGQQLSLGVLLSGLQLNPEEP